MSKFFFRLNKVAITKNGTSKFIVFGSDKAKLQFVSLVVADGGSLPDLDAVVNENDQTKRAALLKTAATNMAGSVIFTPIDNIKSGAVVTFGKHGVIVYQAKEIPDSFSWELLCVKLNQGNRDLGKELLDVVDNSQFDSVAAGIPTIIGTAVSPAYTAGVALAKFVFKAFMTHLSNEHDKQLGILETSFIREIDYPHGNLDDVGVPDEQNNLTIDYTLFGFD